MKNITITIPCANGGTSSSVTVLGLEVEEKDRGELRVIYEMWVELNKKISRIGGRKVNMPEALSESAFCLEMKRTGYGNPVRAMKVKGKTPRKYSISYDTLDKNNYSRQQIKASSIDHDLTSFGPRSQQDEIYFLDFYRDGSFDGKFDVYKIDPQHVDSQVLNIGNNETFTQQQQEGRRPRLSIKKKIIERQSLRPLFTGSIF